MNETKLKPSEVNRQRSLKIKLDQVRLLKDFFDKGFRSFDAFYTALRLYDRVYDNPKSKKMLQEYYLYRVSDSFINSALEKIVNDLKYL